MLTVYKASAGSGKTFRLAVEYIKHLIVAPTSYDHILAVTFTNKATEEMKMRILSQLYGLAHHHKDSQSYMDVILKELRELNDREPFTEYKVDENFIAKRSSFALERLLHNYNFFRVETIDRFFQTVLRNLARELDLSPSLRVELGDDEIEAQAVDTWIDRLKDGDTELTWILDYIRSSMDDAKKWNVIDSIKEFGKILLKDEYKEHSQMLDEHFSDTTKDFYNHYTTELKQIISQATDNANAHGKELWKMITDHGLGEESFSQKGKGVGAFIHKMSTEKISDLSINSYVSKCLDRNDTEAKNWVGSKPTVKVRAFVVNDLRPRFMDVMKSVTVDIVRARSAQITLRHLSKLRLLRAIQDEINASNREQDRFLLSDTQALLSKMINDSDSPFIYEKIGARLQNIMIDEFQDTSRIQWRNFKVLLNDCMSHGHENLIVGDVKQSIYRWRSGDWELLNDIDKEFAQGISEEHLDVNRRSSTHVIDFNNAFFVAAAGNIQATLQNNCPADDVAKFRRAYSDVCQKYPDNKKPSGYVELRLLDKGDYQNQTLKYITEQIIDLTEKNVEQRDIAILVRENKFIPHIAKYCMDAFREHSSAKVQALKIVSDEAYLLNASVAVNIIVDALKLLMSPDDRIIKARLSIGYQRYILNRTETQTVLLTDCLLPQDFIENTAKLSTYPLYQLCEEIYKLFSLENLTAQSAYVCRFFDGVTEYLHKNIGDTASFLKYWDEKMFKKKIESDTENGIRILSIHKSKGLEFGHVIVPFCDWELEKSNYLWCEPDSAPFSDLPVIPLDFSKSGMLNTIYEDDYWHEHLQNEVDNLNLLYVAFTRAKDSLLVTTQKGQGDGRRGKLIEKVLPQVAKDLDAMLENDTLTYGEPIKKIEPADTGDSNLPPEGRGESPDINPFLLPSEPLSINVVTSTKQPEFRESNQSREFTLSDEDEQEQQTSQYIKLGNVMHKVLSEIRTREDIPSAILRLEMDGLLYGQDITPEGLREQIERCFNNPQIADWFSGRWTLYNECTILEYDTEHNRHVEHRPDRVMTNGEETIVLDFKLYSFKDTYKDQVRRYMDLLRRMGHKNVRGFVWQVFSNKVSEVM